MELNPNPSTLNWQMLLFGDADDAAVKPVLETYTKVLPTHEPQEKKKHNPQ